MEPRPQERPEQPRMQRHVRVDADEHRRPLDDYQLATLVRSLRLLMGGEKGEA